MCDAKTNRMPDLSMVEEVILEIPAVLLPVMGKLIHKSENPKSAVETIGISIFESIV
jgi:hypothetical protein